MMNNHWKYLKGKLKKENNQLVSATTQLKITAADGKSKTKAYVMFESSKLEPTFPQYSQLITRQSLLTIHFSLLTIH